MVSRRTRIAAAVAAVAALAAVAWGPAAASATVWRVVGVSPDGGELAAVAIELEPVQGYHRHTLVRFQLADGQALATSDFLPAERHRALRERGDYDLLRHERGQARTALYGALVTAGFRSCRPLALTPVAPPGGEPPALPARHVRATLPSGPALVAVLASADGQGESVALRSAESAAADVLGVVPLREERLNPFETVRYPLAGVRDLFLCHPGDAPARLVAVVETVDPPQPELPPEQHLLAAGRRLSLGPPAPPAPQPGAPEPDR